jgi:hypothetical protein
VRKP